MSEFYKGQKVRVSVAFTLNSVATDPTAVELKVKTPAGVTTSYTWALGTVLKDSTGNFHMDFTPDQEGVYYYGFIGTGVVATASFREFTVRAWPFS